MLRPAALTAFAVLLAAPATFAGNPWEELMGPGKGRVWNDPQGRFYLDLPVGWEAKPDGTTPVVNIWKNHPDNGLVAHVSVEMRTVPPGVKTAHYALQVDTEMKRMPGYRLIERDAMTVGGERARRTLFTYRERSNAELVNEVVQIVFLDGERAFIVTLQTAYGARGAFWEDFEKMMKSFTGRAPGEEGRAAPKERRRVKAGEMINPDAVGY